MILDLALNAVVSAACFLGLWLIGLKLKDVSFIDSWWGLGIGVLALLAFIEAGGHNWVLFAPTEAWAIRLGLYLLWRWRRNGPDPRYGRLLAGKSFALGSLLYVFALQFVLQFIVSLPVQLGQWHGPNLVGVPLAAFGILFEALADWQLVRFKSDPANAGKVMDRGLWRYSRHPNHFGDACAWWGLFLVSGAWWTLPAPLLLTYLLSRWSGVPTVEGRMRRKPDYAAYAARTPRFVPWFPAI